MSPSERPGSELRRLIDWLDGRLAETEAEAVAREVAQGDPRTVATVEWLRGFLVLAESSASQDVPPRVRRDLRQHFEEWSRDRAVRDQAPTELRARLLFDSRLDLVPVGVRGGSDGETWHLAYTSERADVVLDLRRLGGAQVRVDGQVLPADTAPRVAVFEAVLACPGVDDARATGDELGRFSLPSVPAVAGELQLHDGELSISLPLDLREHP